MESVREEEREGEEVREIQLLVIFSRQFLNIKILSDHLSFFLTEMDKLEQLAIKIWVSIELVRHKLRKPTSKSSKGTIFKKAQENSMYKNFKLQVKACTY